MQAPAPAQLLLGGAFLPLPSSCSFLHGLLPFLLLLLLRTPQSPPPLAFSPLSGLPLFPRIRIWVDSAPGAWQGVQGLSGLSPLSLHPLCPSGHAEVLGGATCCVVSVPQTGHLPIHFWTLRSLVVVPCAPAHPSAPPSTSPRPFPSLTPPAPWAARSSCPRYLMSLLFCEGRARLSDLCCSVWCRV